LKTKAFFLKIFRIAAFPWLFRKLFLKRKVVALLYHDIDSETFEKQIKYILRFHHVISVQELLSYMSDEQSKLPAYPLLITFDDGHAGNFKLLEVCCKYNIRPVIFLTTGVAGTETPFWFKLPFKDNETKNRLKEISDAERVNFISEFHTNTSKQERQALSWGEIEEMSKFFDFQSHTHNHPCLPQCNDETIESELTSSKEIIESKLQKECFALAFPNGDFNELIKKRAKENGYSMCFTIQPGFINSESDFFELPRLSTNDTKNQDEFILRATGIWFYMKRFRKIFS
jgi:poly-beta-1,6-N-acetyl-D-glucosamine N-deacetylase